MIRIDESMELDIKSAVDKIAQRVNAKYEDREGENAAASDDLWSLLSESGFVGIGIESEYGGGGVGLQGMNIVAERIAYHGHLPVLYVMSPGIVGSIISAIGSKEQKDAFLHEIASGERKVAFAITEEGAGSNTHNIKTTLSSVESGGFRLKGSKCFISAADQADNILVVARMDGIDGPVCCVVDADDPGVEKTLIQTQQFSADSQWVVHFDDVSVSDSRVIGGLGHGFSGLFAGLNPERVLMASFCNGLALKGIAKAVRYANERSVWGSPIGSHQGLSHPLAKSKVEVELARLMTQKAAQSTDNGEPSAAYANYAKYAAAEAAIGAIDNAIQTHGGNGFTKEYGISDLYWPARLFRTAPVSAEMILNYVSQNVLGLPKSY